MKLPAIKPEYLIGGAVLLAVLYVWSRGVKGVAKDVASGAVDLADGVVTGTVTGIGSVVGLPVPTVSACQASINEFRAAPWYKQAYLSFSVSANCTASDYLRFVATGKAPNE